MTDVSPAWLANTPGVQYVAVNASGIVSEFSGGLADIGRSAPVNGATSMMAYSMSKTLTAVAVLQLIEAGKVLVDEPAVRYVSGVPYEGVTVRQLLSHTSGIPNPLPLRWVHAAGTHAAFDEDAALAGILRANPGLTRAPGTKYRYSNIGYWLLGKVVESASGLRFCDYVHAHIVRPLGLEARDLSYAISDSTNHASGYLERWSFMNLLKGLLLDRELVGASTGRWVEIRPHYVNGAAFGGLVGTARAFGVFLQDQLRGRSVLIGTDTTRLLYEPVQVLGGTRVAMTLGWHIGQAAGRRYFFKEGGGGGFHCLMRLYRDRGLGTVVMTNATAFPVQRFLDEMDRSL